MIKVMQRVIEPWSERAKMIAARWRDVILYGLIGAAIVWVMAIPLLPFLNKQLSVFGPPQQKVLAVLALLLVLYLIRKLSLFRPQYLKNLAVHPPILLSVMLGFSLLFALQGYPACVFAGLTALFIFGLFLFFGFGREPKLAAKNTEELQLPEVDVRNWSASEIINWMQIESPIKTRKELLFGRRSYVERIYNRLFLSPDNGSGEAKTLALLGELGSGKSSILKVLLNHLKQRQANWLALEVDSWERDANTIDEQILEMVIDTLAEHLDVSGYKGIPSDYHDALKSHGSWWAMFSHLVAGDAQAESKLMAMSNLLLQLNKKLLLIVEDPDRGVEGEKEKRCQRIFSLIDRLQRIEGNRIKVIVTGGLNLHGGDLRVIEYKEELDNPAKDYAVIINKLLEEKWDIESQGKDGVWPYRKPVFDGADLDFGTPREFKHVLRELDFLWVQTKTKAELKTELRGEVNLEQLILLSFAKQRSSLIYEYVLKDLSSRKKMNVYAWSKSLPHRGILNVGQKAYDQVKAEEENNKHDVSYNPLTKEVICELGKISRALGHDELSDEDKNYAEKIISKILVVKGRQRITDSSRVDYIESIKQKRRVFGPDWHDALAGAKLKPEEMLPDQEYLKAMRNIFSELQKDPSNPVLKSLDVTRLINCGPLSDYLCWRMKGLEFENEAVPLAAIAWVNLAQAIISKMANIKYTNTEAGHPAGEHLYTIVAYLVRIEESDSVKSIIKDAIAENCSAGAELLVWACRDDEVFSKINGSLTEKWLFYRTAILNSFIVPDEIPSDGEGGEIEISWNFILELQRFRAEDCRNLLRAWKMEHGSDFLSDNENRKAVDKLNKLFEQLSSFKQALHPGAMLNVEYSAKYQIASGNNEVSRKERRQKIIDSLESNNSVYSSDE